MNQDESAFYPPSRPAGDETVPHSSSGFLLDEWAATSANHRTQFVFKKGRAEQKQPTAMPVVQVDDKVSVLEG
jgi:hypothetical protein